MARHAQILASTAALLALLNADVAIAQGLESPETIEAIVGTSVHEKESQAAADPGKAARYLERQCLKTHLRPADIAEMALWLCADESAMCTGQTFTVDGGVA